MWPSSTVFPGLPGTWGIPNRRYPARLPCWVGKTVCLTDAGQVFLRYARTLLTTAQQAKAALQPTPEARGSLRVAIADSLCSALMPDLLEQFHALCPRVEVSLRSANTQEMREMLTSNRADLAYTLDLPLTHPADRVLLDEPEPCCFLAPAGHPLTGRRGLTLADLAGQEFLLTERGTSGGAGSGVDLPAPVHGGRLPHRPGRPAGRDRLPHRDAPPAVLPQRQVDHPPDEHFHPSGPGRNPLNPTQTPPALLQAGGVVLRGLQTQKTAGTNMPAALCVRRSLRLYDEGIYDRIGSRTSAGKGTISVEDGQLGLNVKDVDLVGIEGNADGIAVAFRKPRPQRSAGSRDALP